MPDGKIILSTALDNKQLEKELQSTLKKINALEKSLADMQGSTVKLQLVGDAPQELDILNASVSGRLKTLIVRGEAEEVGAKMAACKPAYFDVLPLSLEEIFIYELGGVDYEIKDILL